MTIRYVTSNMSTGVGSLRQAIADALPGDEIRFSEDVFERGENIEIALASQLTIAKNLTLNSGPFRVVLNGGGVCSCVKIVGASAALIGFDIVRGYTNAFGGGIAATEGADATATRCRVVGCRALLGGGIYLKNATIKLCDCAVYGNACEDVGGGVYKIPGMAASALVLTRSTIAGNVAVKTNFNNIHGALENNDSLIADDASAYGFVAPPPSDYAFETWTSDSWREMDFHLLDDGSANPSPYRDAGTVPDESVLNDADADANYDLDGNWRGRTQVVDGVEVASRSPGAYETIQADLFWIGKDADGNAVESLSWESASGWATSRFATASDATAKPAAGSSVFIGENVAFVDSPSVASTTSSTFSSPKFIGLQIGSESVVDINGNGALGQNYFAPTLGRGSQLLFSRQNTRCVKRFKLGVCASWNASVYSIEEENDVKRCLSKTAFVKSFESFVGFVPSEPQYQTILVHKVNTDGIRLKGNYKADAVAIRAVNPASRTPPIGTEPGTTFRTKRFVYGSDGAANVDGWVSNPIRVVLRDDATAIVYGGGTENAERYADDFSVELENAASATLTLGGQTISGTVVGATTLNGSAKIETSLTSGALNVNADARLTLVESDASVCPTLRLGALSTAARSALNGVGSINLLTTGVWNDAGTSLNGVAGGDYVAETNAVKLRLFDPNVGSPDFHVEDGRVLLTSPAFEANSTAVLFEKYASRNDGASGSYSTIYDSSNVVTDETTDAYETTTLWSGEAKRTLVDAAPNDGWNFYRIGPKQPVVKGLASLYYDPSETRRIAVWAGDGSAPPLTYYYVGGGELGSFANAADWSFSADGGAEFDGTPQFDCAIVAMKNAPLRLDDWSANGVPALLQISFPKRVAIYRVGDAQNDIFERLNDEGKIASVDVPIPKKLTFFVGKNEVSTDAFATSGRWNAVDGATEYEVESTDAPIQTFVVSDAIFWRETAAPSKRWRVRVANPIYGDVKNWSESVEASTPLATFAENETAPDVFNCLFNVGYEDGFPGDGTATIKRRLAESDRIASASNDWEILETDFNAAEYENAPPTSDEYAYRIEWNDAPNVWLETKAARRNVAALTYVEETTFATPKKLASETPTFAARIFRKTTGALLRRDEVQAIRCSLFEVRRFGETRVEREVVDDYGNYRCKEVYVPNGTLRDSLLVDENFWTRDAIGFNFAFVPQTSFFPGAGEYVVRFAFDVVLTEERREGKIRTFCVDFDVDVK